jgi:hypothetical protein
MRQNGEPRWGQIAALSTVDSIPDKTQCGGHPRRFGDKPSSFVWWRTSYG